MHKRKSAEYLPAMNDPGIFLGVDRSTSPTRLAGMTLSAATVQSSTDILKRLYSAVLEDNWTVRLRTDTQTGSVWRVKRSFSMTWLGEVHRTGEHLTVIHGSAEAGDTGTSTVLAPSGIFRLSGWEDFCELVEAA